MYRHADFAQNIHPVDHVVVKKETHEFDGGDDLFLAAELECMDAAFFCDAPPYIYTDLVMPIVEWHLII